MVILCHILQTDATVTILPDLTYEARTEDVLAEDRKKRPARNSAIRKKYERCLDHHPGPDNAIFVSLWCADSTPQQTHPSPGPGTYGKRKMEAIHAAPRGLA